MKCGLWKSDSTYIYMIICKISLFIEICYVIYLILKSVVVFSYYYIFYSAFKILRNKTECMRYTENISTYIVHIHVYISIIFLNLDASN